MAIVLLAAVVALIAWYTERAAETVPLPVTAGNLQPQEKARKPAPTSSTVPRDTARDRPDRERTNR